MLKLALATALLALHVLAGKYRKDFLQQPLPLSEKAFRFLDDAPIALMIAIVLPVVFQPAW